MYLSWSRRPPFLSLGKYATPSVSTLLSVCTCVPTPRPGWPLAAVISACGECSRSVYSAPHPFTITASTRRSGFNTMGSSHAAGGVGSEQPQKTRGRRVAKCRFVFSECFVCALHRLAPVGRIYTIGSLVAYRTKRSLSRPHETEAVPNGEGDDRPVSPCCSQA